MPQKLPGYMSSNEKYNFNVNRFGGNNNYYRNYTNNSGTMNKVNSIFLTVLAHIPNIFIIDFDNRDYFWLSNFNNLRLVYE